MSPRITHVAFELNRLNRRGDTAETKSYHCRSSAIRAAKKMVTDSRTAVTVEKHTTTIYKEMCDYSKVTRESVADHTTVIYREMCEVHNGANMVCSIYRDDKYLIVATLGKERVLRAGGWID